jgi:hypothetical protein
MATAMPTGAMFVARLPLERIVDPIDVCYDAGN